MFTTGLGAPELIIILADIALYALYAMAIVYIIGAGVYFGNKWTKKGELPGILRILESKNNKEK